MKTLLVPTDFSETSNNAIDYAVEIARATHAKLILFHVYHVPVITTEAVVAIPEFKELEQYALDNLKRTERTIQIKHGSTVVTECICKCGFPVEEIKGFTKEHKIDLIVMGMKGAGRLAEKLIGSVTTSMIQESTCAVMVIDEHVRFKSPKKIVLACDYLKTENKSILKPLKQLADLFNAHVYILNVVTHSESSPNVIKTVPNHDKLENSLDGIEYSFHYLQSEDVIRGINTFVEERKMDMVVMLPRKHSAFKTIFSEPNTKQMAFHSKVPLLTLQE